VKNFLAAFLATCCLTTSVAFAEAQDFLNGDKNFPLIRKNSAATWYLDKNSITVKVNDPPFFIVTAKALTNGGTETFEFFFDENEADMRVFDKTLADWRYLNPCDGTADEKFPVYVGEAVFYVWQGRKFYGNYLWKTEVDGKINFTDEFDDSFYKDLR